MDNEVAVSTPTHKAQKRIYADGYEIDHRLPEHGHGTRTAKHSDARFQMAQTERYVRGVAGSRNVWPPSTPRNDLIE